MRILLIISIILFVNITTAQSFNLNIKSETIEYKKIDAVSLKLHVFRPENFDKSENYTCIVFFHGGGWLKGTWKAFRRQSSHLASKGMITISAEYRLKSIHGTTPYEAVADAKSAIRYVRKHASELNINPDMIAAGGGSAGGHLAAVCGNIDGLEDNNEDLSISSKPNALVLFNPVYDNSKKGYGYNFFKESYKEISPLHNISSGAPPTIVFFGTKDKTTPVASSLAYEEKMKEIGSRIDLHLYEGAEHSFFNKGEHFKITLQETEDFLRSLGYISK